MRVERCVCPRCKGRGEKANVDAGIAIFTLGISAVIDLAFPERCRVCDGKGWLRTICEKPK